ncbi:MAG: endonuclease domain-containing protein [Azonexus sp.]
MRDVDMEARTGLCAHCGPVKVTHRGACRRAHATYSRKAKRTSKARARERGYEGVPPECGICGVAPGVRAHARDHNHATGQKRGRLCLSCNVALGHFRDSPELLKAAVAYLRKYEAPPSE